MKEKPTITEIKIEPLVSYQKNDDKFFCWKPHPVLITGFGNIPFPSPCFEARRDYSEPQECGTSVSIDMKFLKNKSEYSYEEIVEGAIVALQENLKEMTERKEMKDKNGIEIDCQNCEAFEYCKDSSAYEQCQNKAFSPSKEAYEARIQKLQNENALLKDEESHIMDVNSEVEILKRELRFTDEELDLIRNAFQEPIWEYKDGWSAVRKIIAKCDELLQERKD